MIRRTFSWAMMAGLALPLTAPAAVLTKMNERSTRAIFSGPELEFARIGDRLKVGNNCEVVIDRKLNEGDNRVGVNTRTCQDTQALHMGASGALISVVDDNTELESVSDIARSTRGYQTSRAQRSLLTSAKTPSEKLAKGFGVGMVVTNTAKSGSVKESVWNSWVDQRFERDLDSGSTSTANVGLNASYSNIARQGVGFSTELMMAQFQQIVSEDAYLYTRPSVNVTYSFMNRFYALGGVNYMMFLQEPEYVGGVFDGQKIGLKPEVGFQVGAGMVIQDRWQAQLQYAQSKQKIDNSLDMSRVLTDVDQGRIAGAYDFSSLELSLMYRF